MCVNIDPCNVLGSLRLLRGVGAGQRTELCRAERWSTTYVSGEGWMWRASMCTWTTTRPPSPSSPRRQAGSAAERCGYGVSRGFSFLLLSCTELLCVVPSEVQIQWCTASTALFSGVPLCWVVYRTIRRCAAVFSGVPHCTVVYRTVEWCSAYTVVYRIVQWCTALYSAVLVCKVLYRTLMNVV